MQLRTEERTKHSVEVKRQKEERGGVERGRREGKRKRERGKERTTFG